MPSLCRVLSKSLAQITRQPLQTGCISLLLGHCLWQRLTGPHQYTTKPRQSQPLCSIQSHKKPKNPLENSYQSPGQQLCAMALVNQNRCSCFHICPACPRSHCSDVILWYHLKVHTYSNTDITSHWDGLRQLQKTTWDKMTSWWSCAAPACNHRPAVVMLLAAQHLSQLLLLVAKWQHNPHSSWSSFCPTAHV